MSGNVIRLVPDDGGNIIVNTLPAPSLTLHMGGVVTGLSGGGTSTVIHEIPTGAINGSNNLFNTLFNFVPGGVAVYLEGVALTIVDDFQTVGTSTIQLTTPPQTGEHLTVSYVKG